jgi:dTDP-4-dehydrorhamnose 3,5-epimerase
MPFEFVRGPLEGVVLVRSRVFHDDRGWFAESYKRSEFEAAGIPGPFLQENASSSTRGVLRGIHYQLPPHAQGKLVTATSGHVYDVCVDLRRGSASFGRWFGVVLRAEDPLSVYVPEGFGHGFLTLSEHAQVSYKCTEEYAPGSERGLRWDDPDLAIDWPTRDVRVSPKDAALPLLRDAAVFESA